MNLDKYPDVLTLRECQKILQVSRGTMLRLLHEGEIPAFRIGNRWRSAERNARIHRAQRILKTTEMEPFRLGIPIRNAWKSVPV